MCERVSVLGWGGWPGSRTITFNFEMENLLVALTIPLLSLPPSLPQSQLTLSSGSHISPDQDRHFFTQLSQDGGYHGDGFHGDRDPYDVPSSSSSSPPALPEVSHPPTFTEHPPRRHWLTSSPLPVPHPQHAHSAPVYPAGTFELPTAIYELKEKGSYNYYPKRQPCKVLGGHPSEWQKRGGGGWWVKMDSASGVCGGRETGKVRLAILHCFWGRWREVTVRWGVCREGLRGGEGERTCCPRVVT